jgi:hypothetical protein
MSKADQFLQYADEALRWARQARTDQEAQAFLQLARTWTEAAKYCAVTPAVPQGNRGA